MSTGRRALAALIVVFFAAAAFAASPEATQPRGQVIGNVPTSPVIGLAKERLRASMAAAGLQPFAAEAPTECMNGNSDVTSISCGASSNGSLANTDCALSDGSYWDAFSFTGVVGQQVTITMTSSAFNTYLFLLRPDGTTDVAQDNDSGGGTNARITFTIDEAGAWFIIANSLTASQFGAYTLSLTCTGGGGGGGGGSCVANSTTLCLNNNRFRVTATFLTNAGQSGNATAVPETTDTGMFWFFSANNIEAIIKVVNGCTLNSRYWVFAGGLTDVQVVLTVVDTSNGTTRTYTNPQSTAFAPIQDTSAFATCP
jgi:Bacterial pre-peptidase C-terminal domain